MQLGDSSDNELLNLHCDIPVSHIAYILRDNMELVVVPCFFSCSGTCLVDIRGMRARCAWGWSDATVTISLRNVKGVTYAIDGPALGEEARRGAAA